MAKIKLNGDTSGYIEISAPAVSGNNTLELGPGTKILTNLDNTFTGITTFNNGLNVTGGNVKIGTTTAGQSEADDLTIATSAHTGMTIRSGATSKGAVYFSDGTSGNNEYRGVLEYNHSDDHFRILTAASERLRIDSSGNLLLKTGEIDIQGGNKTVKTSAGFLQLGTSGSHHTAIITAGTERLRIGSDGKMGLGTNSPAYLAHIHNSGTGSGDNSYLHFTTGDTGATGSDGLTIGVAANETAYINFRESGSLVLATSGTERFRIASDGQATFDKGAVGGANQVISRFQAESSRRLDIVWHDSGSLMGFNTPSNHSYIFKTNNTERVRITNAGRMGIDSGSPISKLQVGSHTFNGGNGMHSDARVGMSNHGNLTGLMLASTYNSGTHPEYGLVFVQGASTSSYNVWGLCPDGPAKGNSLNFHYAPQASNIHAPGYRKFQMTGDGYLLKPSHPSFRVGRHSDYNHTGGQPVQFNTTSGTAHLNQGNHYNTTNHRFVAPVAGVYQFSACVIVNGLSSPTDVTDLFYLFKNGSHMAYSMRRARYVNNYTGTGGYFVDFLSNVNILMAANDYCDIRVRLSVSVHGNATYTWFSGTLVG